MTTKMEWRPDYQPTRRQKMDQALVNGWMIPVMLAPWGTGIAGSIIAVAQWNVLGAATSLTYLALSAVLFGVGFIHAKMYQHASARIWDTYWRGPDLAIWDDDVSEWRHKYPKRDSSELSFDWSKYREAKARAADLKSSIGPEVLQELSTIRWSVLKTESDWRMLQSAQYSHMSPAEKDAWNEADNAAYSAYKNLQKRFGHLHYLIDQAWDAEQEAFSLDAKAFAQTAERAREVSARQSDTPALLRCYADELAKSI